MAIRRIDLLSCGNLDKTPIKTLDFDARQFSTMGRSISMLLLVWEKVKMTQVKEAILWLPLFMFIIYYKKALSFLAILGIVWETFLKNRNYCSQLANSLSCLSQYSGHLTH